MERTRITAVFALVVTDTIVFLLAAATHLDVRIPVGVGVIAEPRILDAALVEGTVALAFLGSAYAIRARRNWAWTVTVTAHVVGIGGILVGIGALAAGLGPVTASNAIYHRTMLVVLLVGLFVLWTSTVRSRFERHTAL